MMGLVGGDAMVAGSICPLEEHFEPAQRADVTPSGDVNPVQTTAKTALVSHRTPFTWGNGWTWNGGHGLSHHAARLDVACRLLVGKLGCPDDAAIQRDVGTGHGTDAVLAVGGLSAEPC
jgi:hypothetical protein